MGSIFDVTHLITTYGQLGIFVIVFLESGIFFPLPGDSLIFAAGLLAPELHFNVILLTFFVFVAAFGGGIVGYYIGTKLELLNRYAFFRKILKKEYIDEAHDFLEKHGLSAMILSRFVPIVRTFLPIVAGIVHMKYYDFIRYGLLGSFIWSASFVLGGYFLGRAFPQMGEEYLVYVIIIVVFFSLLPGVYHYFQRKKQKSL